MDFVFDIDGTLCFDGMSLSKEIQGILERAQIVTIYKVTFLVLLFHIVIAIRFHILLMRSLITLLIRLLKFPLLLMLILKKGESF